MKYLFFSFLVFCLACQGEVSDGQKAATKEVKKVEAQSIESDVLSISDLAIHPWEVQVVLDNGKINKESKWQGRIIQFQEDGSYQWGSETGRYDLDSDNNIIHLQSQDVTLNSEWSIKYRRSVMVWIGTPKYSLQAIQLKLEKPRNITQ